MGWKRCVVCVKWKENGCKTVTPLNVATIAAVLRAEGNDLDGRLSCDRHAQAGRLWAATDCYTDDMVSKHAALVEASKHIGNIVAPAQGRQQRQHQGRRLFLHLYRHYAPTRTQFSQEKITSRSQDFFTARGKPCCEAARGALACVTRPT